jgi:aminoglycoside phosphotransferase (APT) family kinase protein
VRPGTRRAAAASSAGEQWLALVVPADARTFHVESDKLAATLAEAGARIETDASADVEIVSTARAVRGADVAIVEIGPEFGSAPKGLAGRVLHRVLRHVSTRVASARAERQLGKRGYEASTTVWDVAHDVFMPPLATTDGRRPAAEQLPQRALVVARRGPARPTILEQSIAEASEAAGVELAPSKGSVRPGFLLVADDSAMLRVAVGPARREIVENARMLSALHELQAPDDVLSRVPAILAVGRSGLADWTLEARIAGEPLPTGAAADGAVPSCVDFLVSLHAVGRDDAATAAFADAAHEVASICDPSEAALVGRLGAALDERLAGTPRGFAHGDFFPGNLLVRDGELAGVIDWDAGGPGRVPLVDLLHLRLHLEDPPHDNEWGPALVRRLLPWAASGGDAESEEYLARIGATHAPLAELVAAYWLERTAYQLRAHPLRRDQSGWKDPNVRRTLPALAEALQL